MAATTTENNAVQAAGAEGSASQTTKRAEEQALKAAEKKAKEQLRAQRKVRIMIPSGRGPGEQAPVEVGCNGQHFLIVRDVEVDVPLGILNALRDAVEQIPQFDEQGRVKGWTKAMRYNVQVISES